MCILMTTFIKISGPISGNGYNRASVALVPRSHLGSASINAAATVVSKYHPFNIPWCVWVGGAINGPKLISIPPATTPGFAPLPLIHHPSWAAATWPNIHIHTPTDTHIQYAERPKGVVIYFRDKSNVCLARHVSPCFVRMTRIWGVLCCARPVPNNREPSWPEPAFAVHWMLNGPSRDRPPNGLMEVMAGVFCCFRLLVWEVFL